jgi:ADP-ribose pyrophosphatase YjhB (NUDIX family)
MKNNQSLLNGVEAGRSIRVRVAGIILNKRGEILLVNHQKNGKSYWLIPGGGVEYGEDMFTALKREFDEELSLNVTKLGNLVMVHDTIYPGRTRHIVNFYFIVKVKNLNKFRVKPDNVLKGAAFVSRADFEKLLFYPGVKSAIITMWKNGFRHTLGYIKPKWIE